MLSRTFQRFGVKQANPLTNVLSYTRGISLFIRVYKPKRFRSILPRAIGNLHGAFSATGGNLPLISFPPPMVLQFRHGMRHEISLPRRESAKAHAAISTAYARTNWNPYSCLTTIRSECTELVDVRPKRKGKKKKKKCYVNCKWYRCEGGVCLYDTR